MESSEVMGVSTADKSEMARPVAILVRRRLRFENGRVVWEGRYDATWAGLAMARDVYDYCRIYQTGVDEWDLIIEHDDGTLREVWNGEDDHGDTALCEGEGDAVDYDALGITEDGQLDVLEVAALCEEDVWDGSNMVTFIPRHSWQYVAGTWEWTETCGDVQWHLEMYDPDTGRVLVIGWEPLEGRVIIASTDDAGDCEEVIDQLSGLRYDQVEAVAEGSGASVSRHSGYGYCAGYAVTCPEHDLSKVVRRIRSACGVPAVDADPDEIAS